MMILRSDSEKFNLGRLFRTDEDRLVTGRRSSVGERLAPPASGTSFWTGVVGTPSGLLYRLSMEADTKGASAEE